MDTSKRIVLLDNGSVRAASTLALRRIGSDLSFRIGESVEPVSLMHSNKVDAGALQGKPAVVWSEFLDSLNGVELGEIRVVPLFFGPSTAIANRAPRIAAERLGERANALISFAEPLVGNSGDSSLGRLLADSVLKILDTSMFSGLPTVLVVDHGSPSREVVACRDLVGGQVGEMLEGRVEKVVACSMEKREGAAYSFCDPLLAKVLDELWGEGVSEVVLSYMFFSPGRHAGEGGDIADICSRSCFVREGGRIVSCPLVGELPGLVDILAKRYEEKWKSAPR